MLQKMCRKYLKRLLPAAKEVGLEEFVVTTIDKNKSGTCVATRQQVDMLASMCEDNRVKREEIPNIVGKSYRFCLTGNLFKRIRKFKDKGLYIKFNQLIYNQMEIARDKNNNHMQAVVIDTAYNVEQGQTLKLGEGLYRFAAYEDTTFNMPFLDPNHERPVLAAIYMPAGSVEYFYVYDGTLSVVEGKLNIMGSDIQTNS